LIKAAIIGLGRTGSHLLVSLNATGKVETICIKKNFRSRLNTFELERSSVVFICTQDKNISRAAAGLLKTNVNLSGKIIFHVSGAKTSEEIIKLKETGAVIASFHPVQTFGGKAAENSFSFKDIYIAIEGDDKAVKLGIKLSKLLGAYPFKLSKEQKIVHHLCCVICSNYLISLLRHGEKAYSKIAPDKILKNGFNATSFLSIYKPLITQTLKNIEKKGLISALTGPIERNDTDTIKEHLEAIQRTIPEIMPFYIIMGIETVKTAYRKKSLSRAGALNIIKLLNRY